MTPLLIKPNPPNKGRNAWDETFKKCSVAKQKSCWYHQYTEMSSPTWHIWYYKTEGPMLDTQIRFHVFPNDLKCVLDPNALEVKHCKITHSTDLTLNRDWEMLGSQYKLALGLQYIFVQVKCKLELYTSLVWQRCEQNITRISPYCLLQGWLFHY